jgi:hypothetical protein
MRAPLSAAVAAALAAGLGSLSLADTRANAAASAPACAPSTLDASASLAGGALTVSPLPGSMDASYLTQISLLGAPAGAISGVVAVGSRSGTHTGQVLPYSQGDGASFIPATPFAQGELVTVMATLQQGAGAHPLEWQFTTAERDAASHSLETPPPPPPPSAARSFQRYVSNPHIAPPTVTVTVDSHHQAPGDLLLAPYAGPGRYGPMILDADGGLLWFQPLGVGVRAANLRVQSYRGQPVLTWWQDPLNAAGQNGAGDVIADSSYRNIAVVRAGNGYGPDLHAFDLTSQGTALITVYTAIRCDLRPYGGPAEGAVADALVQEIDVSSGLVRFEWHGLDHIALSDSYLPVRPGGTPVQPWDFLHLNSIEVEPAGNLLVDARNTWAAYDLDPHSGQILWQLGGKRSSIRVGPGASTAWQHDARLHSDGTISFFDNGAGPRVHPESRGLVLALNLQTMSATRVSSFDHYTPLVAESQGDLQSLAGGDWIAGWGQQPYFSEFAPSGRLLFDAHLPATWQSFTVFKYAWTGHPTQPPRLAARRTRRGGLLLYASWNGATDVSAWRVLAGRSPRRLAPIAIAARRGFETAIALPRAHRYVAVRALGPGGAVLGTSAVVHG